MTLSGYPPGVTGLEYEIAGPDHEEEREEHCIGCDAEIVQSVEGYRGQEWFRCSLCGTQNDLEPGDFGPDPDELYDRMRDDSLVYGR